MGALEKLELYKFAKEYRNDVLTLTNTFPKEEKFQLCGQIRNSVRSITANIAEAYGRYHFQESIQFCRQARGSLFETYDHLSSALAENYITQEQFDSLHLNAERVLKLLNGYINYLKKQKENFSQLPRTKDYPPI